MKTRSRFAPSPTGFLHIGSLRTALYAYALARHDGGEFILRIEDTDQKREVKGAVKSLKRTLKIFSLNWDEYYVQSERNKEGLYKKMAEKLVNDGNAFYCQCKAKNAKDEGFSNELRDPCRDKGLKSGAIKLKVPNGEKISFHDIVHDKDIEWDTDTVYDATLMKSDGFPTYHLAVVVDDTDMKITHVLRGHDWLPSTPIHLLVYKYLKQKPPAMGHLTDILSSETGKKLSKRSGSFFVNQFLEEGYLPEALLNFVMLLGWASGDDREIFTLNEFVENFSVKGFQKANPTFFKDKLDWMNGQYLMKLTDEELSEKLKEFYKEKYPEKLLEATTPLLKTRIRTLKDFDDMAKFFVAPQKVDKNMLGKNYKKHLNVALDTLGDIDNWKLENINSRLMASIEKNNFSVGKFFMDLRIAITGSKFTPPINESIVILGKKDTLKRLKAVVN